ncbi:NRPS-like enzyme [Penicillium malachiteum]|uniref:NRPS-like enzyme n=1 Tax=Penicillium malachiteum TaxID=1324776 RepID=UPI002549423A|nr:NRPS-like enzyme [Penicillium malachiteum]KAJ5715826.1 NRPS-like enzyme [Penicillium malachiteum]
MPGTISSQPLASPQVFQAPKRLLVTLVDKLAKTYPKQRFGLIPNGTEIEDGFREITFLHLSQAVNAASWWILKNMGESKDGGRFAYIGNNDIRYIILMLAAHKTNYTIVLPSTRLSDEAYEHVLRETECEYLLFSHEKESISNRLRNLDWKMKFLEVPTASDILSDEAGNNYYAFSKTYDEMVSQVALIIHSSGTTGMPKPVPLNHGFLGAVDFSPHLPRPAGRNTSFFNDLVSDDHKSPHLILSMTPYFHLMGLLSFWESIFHNIPFVASPEKLLSVDFVINIVRHTKPTATLLPPSILEDMSHSEDGLACLSSMEFVCYGGAPLAPEVGKKLMKYTKLRSPIGSSEMGILSSMVPEGEDDWGYFEWNPHYHIDMQPIGDGLYELVIPRVENSLVIHSIFHTFPTLKEYRSKDLYVPHPTNPNLWKYHGRFDDVIVLSNGEKLNPISLEKMVEGHPAVHRALVIGSARFQTCLLIEPGMEYDLNTIDHQAFIDDVWSVVEAGNETVPRYGQISKSMVRLSSREKPFKLTPKGTTQRRAVNNDYSDEIDHIYACQDKQPIAELPESITPEGIYDFLQCLVSSLTGQKNLQAEDDLYSMGLDSLQAIQLSKTLKTSVSSYNSSLDISSLSVQGIYGHPTLHGLTNLMLRVLGEKEFKPVTKQREEIISQLIAKYTSNLSVQSPSQSSERPAQSTFILTGSTGSLGSYVLSDLLSNPSVAKVYCFNRSEDGLLRQTQGFQEKGLDASLLSDLSRVEFIYAHFGAEKFGLDATKFQELLQSVDLVIHNAWKVNFNHPVSSFEDPHLKGVHTFVNFCLESRFGAHLAFISSVSTIGSWVPHDGQNSVPEIPMEDVKSALEQGYGESKFVGESICVEASRKAGLSTSILRVGQIAGPDTRMGVWNPHEWIPTLVKTAKATGKVPTDLGGYPIDWISVDCLARIVNELLIGRPSSAGGCVNVFHLVNPSRTTWDSLVPAIQERYSVNPVSLAEWVKDLAKIQNPSDLEVSEKPALKLLSFYQALAESDVLSTEISVEQCKKASKTMATLEPVSQAQMSNWISQWDF